jgi:hypothetical protein
VFHPALHATPETHTFFGASLDSSRGVEADRISLTGTRFLVPGVLNGIVLWGATNQTGTGYHVPESVHLKVIYGQLSVRGSQRPVGVSKRKERSRGLLEMRVGQHAFFNTGKTGELVRLDDVRLYDVPDLMAQGVKIIRKQLAIECPIV